MQTFLPYASFARSASCLDDKRLGKQRVEAMQILRALRDPDYGWQNHPAVRMWRGYEDCLAYYQLVVMIEWELRGFRNELLETPSGASRSRRPPWIGREDFHASHRSNLLRKNPEHYRQFGWTEPPTLPYVWPKEEPWTEKSG